MPTSGQRRRPVYLLLLRFPVFHAFGGVSAPESGFVYASGIATVLLYVVHVNS